MLFQFVRRLMVKIDGIKYSFFMFSPIYVYSVCIFRVYSIFAVYAFSPIYLALGYWDVLLGAFVAGSRIFPGRLSILGLKLMIYCSLCYLIACLDMMNGDFYKKFEFLQINRTLFIKTGKFLLL